MKPIRHFAYLTDGLAGWTRGWLPENPDAEDAVGLTETRTPP